MSGSFGCQLTRTLAQRVSFDLRSAAILVYSVSSGPPRTTQSFAESIALISCIFAEDLNTFSTTLPKDSPLDTKVLFNVQDLKLDSFYFISQVAFLSINAVSNLLSH